MEKGAVFPLFYLPPVEYFSRIVLHKENILFENAENFQKQSYRNRATIHSPNGKLDLTVPVIKGSKSHTKMKDVRISYDFQWQRMHLMSLQTSYRSSAYFEFYEDDFTLFYEKQWNFLFDYNEELTRLLLKLLKINTQIVLKKPIWILLIIEILYILSIIHQSNSKLIFRFLKNVIAFFLI
jgi:hypothetical protein